jgi:HAD superfamily hydrolase (TIGR01662 family)
MKYLFFDLGGTLCDIPVHDKWTKITKEGAKKALRNLSIPEVKLNEFSNDFTTIKSKLRTRAKDTLEEFEIKTQFKEFLNSKKIKVSYDKLVQLERDFISTELKISYLFSDTKDTLNQLSKNYEMYILSNNVSRVLVEEILRINNIQNYFKKIYVSSDIGFRKPHVNFIKYVLNDLAVKPSQCVMIGDRLDQDIKMANESGIPSIFIDIIYHPDNLNKESIKPNFKIKSLKELKKILLK